MVEIGYSTGMGRVYINANGSEYLDLPTARMHLQQLQEAIAMAELREGLTTHSFGRPSDQGVTP